MLLAIEGIDGSGKATQAKILAERATAADRDVFSISFPAFTHDAYGEAVTKYLNGGFGNIYDIPPELTALLFAGNRLACRGAIESALGSGKLVISDRYVSSNLAHQGAKLSSSQRSDFYDWIHRVEFGVNQMPRPALTILIDTPIELAARRIASRDRRDYTDQQADFHEKDSDYLERCAAVYQDLVGLCRSANLADVWLVVKSANEDGSERTIEEIADEIWSGVQLRI